MIVLLTNWSYIMNVLVQLNSIDNFFSCKKTSSNIYGRNNIVITIVINNCYVKNDRNMEIQVIILLTCVCHIIFYWKIISLIILHLSLSIFYIDLSIILSLSKFYISYFLYYFSVYLITSNLQTLGVLNYKFNVVIFFNTTYFILVF